MKRLLQWTLLMSLLLALLAALGGFFIWQEIASHSDVSVSINGEDLRLQELHAAHWASLMVGGLLITLVLLVVLPLALLLSLGLPLLIVAGVLGLALLALLSLGSLLLSPLLLLGLLLWLLLRRAPDKPGAGATRSSP